MVDEDGPVERLAITERRREQRHSDAAAELTRELVDRRCGAHVLSDDCAAAPRFARADVSRERG